MSKSRQDELIKFDSRMIEYNMNRGTLTKEELEKHLASLPDLAAQAEKIDLDETGDGGNETLN